MSYELVKARNLTDEQAHSLLTAIREDARTFTGPTPRRRYTRRERREKRINFQRTVLDCAREIRTAARHERWMDSWRWSRACRGVREEQALYDRIRGKR